MKRDTDDLYGARSTDQEVCRTAVEMDETTRRVAEVIGKHKGRANAITLGTLCDLTGRYDRAVKGIVEDLIMTHSMLIGSCRDARTGGKYGYFLIVDADDYAAACGAYQQQIETMQKRMTKLGRLAQAAGVVR